MREQVDWTIPLGTWHGMPLRLHANFLLFAVAVLYVAQLSSRDAAGQVDTSFVLLAAASLLVLYLSLLAHELSHWWMASRYGGQSPALVIGPLGGLNEWDAQDDPRAEIMIYSAGPLCNLLLALVPCAILVRWLDPSVSLTGLLDPLQPSGLPIAGGLTWAAVAGIAFWINWTLFVVNLFPAFPFDGGRILRATVRLSRPQLGRELAGLLVARLARLAAIGLLITACLVRNEPLAGPIAPWFALAVIAGVVWFTGGQQERATIAQLHSTPWLAALPAMSLPAPRRHRPAEEPEIDSREFSESFATDWEEAPNEREREREEEQRVDEVLARLHQVGLENLTPEERALLERASARYRNRSGSRSSPGRS